MDSYGLNKDRYFGRNRKLKATEFACMWPKNRCVSCIGICAMYGYCTCTRDTVKTGIAYALVVQHICLKRCSRVHPRARIVQNGQ